MNHSTVFKQTSFIVANQPVISEFSDFFDECRHAS